MADEPVAEQGAAPLPELVKPKENEYGEQNNANDSDLDDDSTRSILGFSSDLRTSDEGKLDEEKALDHPGTGSGSGGNSGAGDAPGDGPKLAELPDGGGAAVVVGAEPVSGTDLVPPVAPKNVLPFATRGAKKSRLKPLKSTRATGGAGSWKVDFVTASRNTYCFRIRWAEGRKRQNPVYRKFVSSATFNAIREGNYEQFKAKIIADYLRSVCAGEAAG